MVVQFSKALQWWNIYNLLNQMVDRISFVVQEELEELVSNLNGTLDAPRARALYDAGYASIYLLSKAKPVLIMKAL